MKVIGNWRMNLAVALATIISMLLAAPVANAATPDFVVRMTGDGKPGGGAGEVNNARAIAGNPSTGHVYVADLNNARIDEYTAWGSFVKAWGWGVADGGAELQTCGPSEPEAMPAAELCQAGIPGSGRGQISPRGGIDVDDEGNVWVGDLGVGSLRIQKFSPAGEFLLMIGGEVNKTKVEEGAPAQEQNRCPVDPADVCQAGSAGVAPGYIASTVRNVIAYSSTADAIVVGDNDRVQIFNLDGTYREAILFEGTLAAFEGKPVSGLDVDANGNIYLSVSGLEDIYKLSPAGVPLAPGKPGESKFEVEIPLGVAVDVQGAVYAIDDPTEAFVEPMVLKFDATGNPLVPTKAEEEAKEFFPYLPFQGPALNGIATNICTGSEEPGNLYVAAFKFGQVSYVDIYGTGPAGCEPPPPVPPVIVSQYATSVGVGEAAVEAQINPRFWNDTTYYVEYGQGKCFEGGCDAKVPVPPALLTGKVTNKGLKTEGILLKGLEPAQTYNYRFVTESGGGGPIFGEDPDQGGPKEASFEAGVERSFTTFALQENPPPCSNDALRFGAGRKLPDCRAYEMVSPLDKENGDVALWMGRDGKVPHLFEHHQSALTGERFTYTSAFPFADPQAAPYVSQYLAERTSVGWSSEAISPPRSAWALEFLRSLNNEFKAFSDDLCTAWLRHNSVSTLAPDAVPGYANLYRSEYCVDSQSYEALTTVAPPERDAEKYSGFNIQGVSADGAKSVFVAEAKLTDDAPALKAGELLLYMHSQGATQFVCRLPNGTPNPTACGAGAPAGQPDGQFSNVSNAISADGSRVFWTAFSGKLIDFGPSSVAGQIYLRLNPDKEQSAVTGGVCTEPEKACTLAISKSVSSEKALFWGASEDGSKVIFQVVEGLLSGNLYEFDVESREASLIAKGVEGPMGMSEDASQIYFASKENLDGEGGASAGAHNLYLYEANEGAGGDFTFVMALSGADIGGTETQPSSIEDISTQRLARVTADGLYATFTSQASPTPEGYDNLDAITGEPDQEVYRYDAQEKDLTCISCNPTGARPTGETGLAARIQGWEVLLHAPRVISEDGSRVHFESFEALVPRDTNGAWDVYQWEEPGAGSCTEADPTFGEASGGCVDLISSGESPADSTFLDADPSGENVFIGTMSSLVAQDYGLNDVYDVRVGGGFPPPTTKRGCEGEACQSPPPAPPEVTPASEAFQGPEDPRSFKPKPRRCKAGMRKVRRKGRTRCVRKAKRNPTRRPAR